VSYFIFTIEHTQTVEAGSSFDVEYGILIILGSGSMYEAVLFNI
jgi:hypothetical protein